MSSLSLNLVDNLAQVTHKIKCKYALDNNNIIIKCIFEVHNYKYINCKCYFEYKNVNDDLIIYKFLCCNRNLQRKFDWWNLKEMIHYYIQIF